MAVLFLDPSQLLLYVHRLHLLDACSILSRVWLPIIRQSCLLPASFFFSGYVLPSGAVINVVTLASKALEVVRDVRRVDRCRVALLGFVSLFFPAWIKQFNWMIGQ